MQQSLEFDSPSAAAPSDVVALDPRRLDVYAVALDFHSRASRLATRRGQSHLRDQLSRASLSIALNVAEGAGRVAPADKGRFYAIARGSACECWAILDVLDRSEGLPLDGRVARSLLVRIVQMLTRLAPACAPTLPLEGARKSNTRSGTGMNLARSDAGYPN